MNTNQIRSTRTRRIVGSLLGLAVTATALAALPASTAQATAPLKWAVSDGSSMTRSSGTTGFTKLGTGRFEVTFASKVNGCAFLASTAVSGTQAQTVFTAGGHLDAAKGVYVETKNQGGGLSDAPFSLFLACGNTGGTERRAVVGYDGTLERGSAGTTVTNLGTGRYTVTFNRNASACTPIATVGDPATGLVFNPGHVSTSRVAGKPGAIYVETKNLAGGLTSGIPFHLATVCGGKDVVRASVDADGTPVAGSALTSSFSSGTGTYTIAGNRNLGQCAWLTTRSEHGTDVPFTPTTVEATAGPAANTVNISQKVQLQLGGAPSSQAFGFLAAC